MPLTITPTIDSITINAHTYTHADWEANTPGTISGLANDFVATIQALGDSVGAYTESISGNTTISSGNAINLTFIFTGVLSGVATITFPAGARTITVVNNTTGGFGLLVGYATGTKATIPAAGSGDVYGDGTNHKLVNGIASASGGVSMPGTLAVAGAATLTSTLALTGAATLAASLAVGTTLGVTGAATLSAALTVAGLLTANGAIVAADDLSVAGNTLLTGTLDVGDDLTAGGDIICIGGIVAPAIAARHASIGTAFYADSPSGTESAVIFQDTSVTRWLLGKGTGSDFRLARYNSSGVYQSDVFIVDDATGRITLNVPTSASGLSTGQIYSDSLTLKLAA